MSWFSEFMDDARKEPPRTIIFFRNGTAAVCNRIGQMPKYQCGNHQDAIQELAADGIDWRTIPDILGSPMTEQQCEAIREEALRSQISLTADQ